MSDFSPVSFWPLPYEICVGIRSLNSFGFTKHYPIIILSFIGFNSSRKKMNDAVKVFGLV